MTSKKIDCTSAKAMYDFSYTMKENGYAFLDKFCVSEKQIKFASYIHKQTLYWIYRASPKFARDRFMYPFHLLSNHLESSNQVRDPMGYYYRDPLLKVFYFTTSLRVAVEKEVYDVKRGEILLTAGNMLETISRGYYHKHAHRVDFI